MNIKDALQSIDIDEVLNSMTAYAISRLKTVGIKNFEGKEPIDFVSDVFFKSIEGKRNWNNAQCSFKEFLFGCLKSDISNFFASQKDKKEFFIDEIPEIPSIDQPYEILEEKNKYIELLKEEGASDDEITVFECWIDGIEKSAEIAKDLRKDVKEIYAITKKLLKRLTKIQGIAKKLI